MTNTKELIHRLNQMRILALDEHIGDPVDAEALDMAIEALTHFNSNSNAIKNELNDTISRQSAIDAIHCDITVTGRQNAELVSETIATFVDRIKALPSAQPVTAKRIVGKSKDGMTLWYQCDMCNEPVDAQDNFCRGCGRRLTDG